MITAGFDIETTHTSPLKGEIVSMQFAIEEGETYYTDIKSPTWREDVQHMLNDLADPTIKIIMHNAIFEYSWILYHYGVRITNFEDTMLLPFILDKGVPFEYLQGSGASMENNRRKLRSVGLKNLVHYYCKENINEFEYFDSIGTKKEPGITRIIRALYTDTTTPLKEIFKGKGKVFKEEEDREALYNKFTEYAKKDPYFTLQIWDKFKDESENESYCIEKRLVPSLARLQLRGIQIDQYKLKELEVKYIKELESAENKLKELAGDPDFTPSKKRKLAEILTNRGHILSKTPSGQLATNKKALASIHDPICTQIEIYNKAAARKRQNIDGINTYMDSDCVLHPNYISAGTIHGRFACRPLNLMNLPKDGIRQVFKARPGYVNFFFDYSQIELRIAAKYLKDPLWLKEFQKEDADLHAQTASIVFNVTHPTKEQRDFGKTLNFAILYGAGVGRVQQLLVDAFGGFLEEHREEATTILTRFRKAHPSLRTLSQQASDRIMSDRAKQDHYVGYLGWESVPPRKAAYRGYVQNSYQRRYSLPPFLHYKILEYLSSGDGTGDMIKLKTCEVAEHLIKNNLNAFVLGNTHDELITEIAEDSRLHSTVVAIKNIMENVEKTKGIVPIKVDVEYGPNWQDKKEYSLCA